MAKTKIFVLHLKEIVYTAIFVILGILLILLLIFMFSGKDEANTSTTENIQYKAGVYNQSVGIGENVLNLEVVVDKDHINSIRIVNIDEAVTTMYPLIEPSLETLAVQLSDHVPIDEVSFTEDAKFTQTILLNAIKQALDKASIPEE